MEAIDSIKPNTKDGILTLSTRNDQLKMFFLGSSCPASVNPGEMVDSFTVSPGAEEAVVAIKTRKTWYAGAYEKWDEHHFLLPVSQRDSSPWIELQDAFVPKPDHLGQIVANVGLSVRIGDEFFLAPLLVSSYDTEKKLAALRTQYRLVASKDANLLCRFIAGKADADEVKAAAQEFTVQMVDIPALQAELTERINQLENVCRELRGRLENAKKLAEVPSNQPWWKKTPRKNLDKLALFLWSEDVQDSLSRAAGAVPRI